MGGKRKEGGKEYNICICTLEYMQIFVAFMTSNVNVLQQFHRRGSG